MIVSGAVNLEFQGQFIPISLRPILRMVEVYVMAVVWSPCSYLLQPGESFRISKTAHRICLNGIYSP